MSDAELPVTDAARAPVESKPDAVAGSGEGGATGVETPATTASAATGRSGSDPSVSCPSCGWHMGVPRSTGQAHDLTCSSCRRVAEVEAFPALFAGPRVGRSGTLSADDDATCFYHDNKRAEAVCDRCGRYVCALCEIDLGGRHLCLECFERGRKGNALPHVVRFRWIPASVALWLAIGSVALSFLGVVTALAAVGMALWGLRSQASITGRSSAGTAVLALGVAGAVIALWAVLFGAVFWGMSRGVLR